MVCYVIVEHYLIYKTNFQVVLKSFNYIIISKTNVGGDHSVMTLHEEILYNIFFYKI